MEDNEGQTQEGDKSSETSEDSNNGNPAPPLGAVELAKQERTKLEGVLSKITEVTGRLEAMKVTEALGGQAEGGKPSRPPSETPVEYKNRIMRGENG